MQIPAETPEIVTAEAVLVPPVVHGDNVTGENEHERRQRTQLVDPHSLLKLHPFLDFGREVAETPPGEVDDHDAGIEVTGVAIGEGERQRGIGPESGSEIGGEIGVAVLRGGEYGVV